MHIADKTGNIEYLLLGSFNLSCKMLREHILSGVLMKSSK